MGNDGNFGEIVKECRDAAVGTKYRVRHSRIMIVPQILARSSVDKEVGWWTKHARGLDPSLILHQTRVGQIQIDGQLSVLCKRSLHFAV